MATSLPTTVPATLVRGGTSRAVFLPMSALPADQAARDELCLRLVGSPDPQAVDGLGGGFSSNSKVMFVGPATSASSADATGAATSAAAGAATGADLETLFAQVSPTEPVVDWTGNCGNISSAILHYARHVGMFDGTSATVWNINSQALFELVVDGSDVDMRFLKPGGEKCGTLFPAGRRCEVNGVEVSLIDVSNPLVIAKAADLGVDPALGMAKLNEDAELIARLERLRVAAGARMGLAPSKVIPRIALLADADTHLGAAGSVTTPAVRVVMTSVGRVHHAMPGTAILALAGAAALGGTIVDDFIETTAGNAQSAAGAPTTITLQHFKGEVAASALVTKDALEWAAFPRTARVLLHGEAYVG